tara:strand:+ start:18935 stop:19303 length:369 start_codon:yes stop_codon:yes gene_type:complete
MQETFLKIENIQVWARVGVLEKERTFGQLFSIDVFLWSDFEKCITSDNVNLTIDYSVLIKDIKNHAKIFSCQTIEKYSEVIMDLIIKKFNPHRLKISLTKCNPPIIGFSGNVSIVKNYERDS